MGRKLVSDASMGAGPCNDRRPAPGNRRETKSAHGTAPSGNLCDELTSDHNPASPSWRADVRDKANEDSVLEELKAMGAKGLTIERAREQEVQILQGHNRCA